MGESKRRAEAKAKGIMPIIVEPRSPNFQNIPVRTKEVKQLKKALIKKNTDEGNNPDKGLKNGSCNRSACQKPGATWLNTNGMYYCMECAGMINDAYMGRSLFEQRGKTPICIDEGEDPPGTEKFVCVRVCSIGEAKFTIRDKEGMEGWLAYNLQDRWGQSLFVNGEYKGGGKGYQTDEQNERVSLYLKSCLERDMQKPIEQPRMQPEYFGGIDLGTRVRYNDERLYENLAHITKG